MEEKQSIQEILASLGYRLRDEGKSWRSRAVYRGGKNENSMVIYKDSGVWTDYGGNVVSQPFGKLMELHGIKSFSMASPVKTESDEEDDSVEDAQMDRVYPESVLSRLLPHYKFYVERGISIESLKRLRSGMASSGKMYQRFVFPIYSKEEKIIGFSGRYMGNKETKIKWKHLGKKRKWVYPLYVRDREGKLFVKEAIEKSGEIIFVESIGDVLAFHERGIFNVLVSFGLDVSPAMICAILELSPKRIFLSYNNDESKGELSNNGKNAAIKNFLLLLPYFDYNCIGICLPPKNDFGDMNDIDFEQWLGVKMSTDYDEQRVEICEMATILKNAGKITEKAYKNLNLLDCQ